MVDERRNGGLTALIATGKLPGSLCENVRDSEFRVPSLEFRVPKNKKSAIFLIFRGSFNPRLRGSKNNEIEDFWFFGISGSGFGKSFLAAEPRHLCRNKNIIIETRCFAPTS